MGGVGSLSGIVLEARDPEALARFYSVLTGLPVVFGDEEVVAIGERPDSDFHLSFQRAPDHEPPTWPDPRSSMQAHLHIRVSDLDQAERTALELGASSFAVQPSPDGQRVMADPAGHPFCLVPVR
jgi:catechol 2,3-dioxygenase-like lactoylglutathione lyase family enzyme